MPESEPFTSVLCVSERDKKRLCSDLPRIRITFSCVCVFACVCVFTCVCVHACQDPHHLVPNKILTSVMHECV